MRIIVDANIVFSAILNTNSKIADLLLNSKGTFAFLAPGDKVLRNGLENKGYKNVISTEELFEIRETKRKI